MPSRQVFEQQLTIIQDELIRLSGMVCQAILDAVDALKNRDLNLARQVIVHDRALNRVRFRVDQVCLELLATQQPAAIDLRRIISAMNVVLDLERMGDHAVNVAKAAIRNANELPLKPLIDIPRMADICCDMIRKSLRAYTDLDIDAARVLIERDDMVDQLYDQVFRELFTYMNKDERTIKRAMHLLFVAHNLERIADRVTNVCERVVYLKTGDLQELA